MEEYFSEPLSLFLLPGMLGRTDSDERVVAETNVAAFGETRRLVRWRAGRGVWLREQLEEHDRVAIA